MRTLVLDLENVLAVNWDRMTVHPEAALVLRLARHSFDRTFLWTSVGEDALPFLQRHSFCKYIDKVIGPMLIHRVEGNGLIYDDMLPPDSFGEKDLAALGDPAEFVLIDNDPRLCRPKERVVAIPPYQGKPGHDLFGAYLAALRKSSWGS